MANLISELKRRGVIKVAAAYALASWILIEAGSVILPTFGAPDWFFRSYVIFVLIGFIISLIAAWFFQFSEGSLHRELEAKDTNSSPSTPIKNSSTLNFILIAMLVVALGISLSLNFSGFRQLIVSDTIADDSLSIAVLPFTNISDSSNNSAFADGMHDDLLTKLANIESLRVISRTSVMAYRETTKNLRDVGEELGASTILEGSVQRIGDSVRINMQLIDASTDEHLWAETYDRELTAKNIFAIQSEISTQITTALKATISVDEIDRIWVVPTENIEAYRLYVAGRQNLQQRLYETLLTAKIQFEQAIQLDPNYADAYSGLADSILLLHINHNDITADIAYVEVQKAIDQALAINPNHADAFATQGLLYSQMAMKSSKNELVQKAELTFTKALKLNPSNASAWMWYSTLSERNNNYSQAIEFNKKSLALDPLGRIPYLNIAKLQSALGNNDLATMEYLKGISIHPDWPMIFFNLVNHLQRLGRLDEAMAWFEAGRAKSSDRFKNLESIGILFELGLYDQALKKIENIEPDNPAKGIFDAYALAFSGETKSSIEYIEKNYAGLEQNFPFFIEALVKFALMSNDLERVTRYTLQIDSNLEKDNVVITPKNQSFALNLAYVWIQNGDIDRANRLIEKVLAVINVRPQFGIAGYGIVNVQALALLGRNDEALAAFSDAVSEGFISSLSFQALLLEQDPLLDTIRDNPVFISQVKIINDRKSKMRNNVEIAQSTNDWSGLLNITKNNLIANIAE